MSSYALITVGFEVRYSPGLNLESTKRESSGVTAVIRPVWGNITFLNTSLIIIKFFGTGLSFFYQSELWLGNKSS
jgi:hypothetical protein